MVVHKQDQRPFRGVLFTPRMKVGTGQGRSWRILELRRQHNTRLPKPVRIDRAEGRSRIRQVLDSTA